MDKKANDPSARPQTVYIRIYANIQANNIIAAGAVDRELKIYGNIRKNMIFHFSSKTHFFIFFLWSRRPGRYLKTFLTPVASFSQSMSPWRATTTPFSPKITNFPSFHNCVNKPNSSQTQFHLHSISPSTVPPNYRTHLGISATPCYVESSSWLIL